MNTVDLNALKSDIRQAIINQKVNASPIAVRLAWHASGTYTKEGNCGGSNGATMRFDPESSDSANNGLNIIRDLLEPVKRRHPEITYSDLWIYAGICAIEFLGGPTIPFGLGRSDAKDHSSCPVIGLLPDGSQGAEHLRKVFYRMGFNDQDIVALSGGHTLGRCHRNRSGFEGPWTRNPLKFDNQFYRNLLNMKWRKKEWDGNLQFEDELTGDLMMLPTDMALIQDEKFKKYVEIYANDEDRFFQDFADAYSRLVSNGCPQSCKINMQLKRNDIDDDDVDHQLREACMHGNLTNVLKYTKMKGDINSIEATSQRTALHKACFWGHVEIVDHLLKQNNIKINLQDYNGDTPLHDAVRYGHIKIVDLLLKKNAAINIQNRDGKNVINLANDFNRLEILNLLKNVRQSKI